MEENGHVMDLEQEPEPESSPPQAETNNDSPLEDGLNNEEDSQERYSRSKLQYEPDSEDYELRKKLLESRMARKKTEEDAKILMNRLLLLKNEEQKVGVIDIWIGLEEDRRDEEEGGGDNKNKGEEFGDAKEEGGGINTNVNK